MIPTTVFKQIKTERAEIEKHNSNIDINNGVLQEAQKMKNDGLKTNEITNYINSTPATQEAKEFGKEIAKGNKSAEEFAASQTKMQSGLKGTATGMKVTAAASRVLSSALNMIAGMAIAFVISLAIEGIEKWANKYKDLASDIKDTASAIKSNQDEINSLNSKLKENQEQIDKINGKDKITLTDAEEIQKLRESNKELQRQKELLESTNSQKKKENEKDSNELYDAYWQYFFFR